MLYFIDENIVNVCNFVNGKRSGVGQSYGFVTVPKPMINHFKPYISDLENAQFE